MPFGHCLVSYSPCPAEPGLPCPLGRWEHRGTQWWPAWDSQQDLIWLIPGFTLCPWGLTGTWGSGYLGMHDWASVSPPVNCLWTRSVNELHKEWKTESSARWQRMGYPENPGSVPGRDQRQRKELQMWESDRTRVKCYLFCVITAWTRAGNFICSSTFAS